MGHFQTIPAKSNTESLKQALKVLNEAADSSSDEIRSMIEYDFLKFKHILNKDKATVGDVLSELQQTTAETLTHTTEKVVSATKETARMIDKTAHKNPWLFVGIAVILSSLTSYIFASKTKR